jgi:hypothetical protein
MCDYFHRYADTRGITPLVHLNTSVTSISRREEEDEKEGDGCGSAGEHHHHPYTIKVCQQQQQEKDSITTSQTVSVLRSKFVVVATGVFARGFVPDDLKQICIEEAPWVSWMHLSAEKPISLTTTTTTEEEEKTTEDVPWDRLWETRQPRHDTAPYNSNVTQRAKHEFLSTNLPRSGNDVGTINELLAMDPLVNCAQMIITDHFLEYVEQGKIQVAKASDFRDILLKKKKKNGNEEEDQQDDGEHDGQTNPPPVTHVIFATGYRCDVHFLSDTILSPCQPDFTSDFLPLILGKSTIHPTLSDIGFVGLYRGPYIPSLEVQGTWLAHLFIGGERKDDDDEVVAVQRPEPERLEKMLETELFIREFKGCTPEEIEGLARRRQEGNYHHPSGTSSSSSLSIIVDVPPPPRPPPPHARPEFSSPMHSLMPRSSASLIVSPKSTDFVLVVLSDRCRGQT